jgi:hypothetical protein
VAIANRNIGTLASAGAASISPTFGASTTAGDLLVAVAGCDANVRPATTASGWTRVDPAGPVNHVGIFYKQNCAAGETAPTFTATGAAQMWAELSQWSGADTTAPLDQSGNATTSSGTLVSTAAADAAASSLEISCMYLTNSKSATYTISNSFSTGLATSLGDSGATKATFAFGGSSGLTTANSSADGATWTITPSTGALSSVVVVVASFKPAPVVAEVIPDFGLALTVT